MQKNLFILIQFFFASFLNASNLEVPLAFSLSPKVFDLINKEFKEGFQGEEKNFSIGDHRIENISRGDFNLKNLQFKNTNLKMRVSNLNLRVERNQLYLNAKISSLSLSINDLYSDYSIKKEKMIKVGFFKKKVKFSHSDSFKCRDLKLTFPKTNIQVGLFLTPSFQEGQAKMNISGEEVNLNLDSLQWELAGCGGAPGLISKHFQKMGKDLLKKNRERIKEKLKETLDVGTSYVESVFTDEATKEFSLDLAGSPFSKGLGVKSFTLNFKNILLKDQRITVLAKLRADGAPRFFSSVNRYPVEKVMNYLSGHSSRARAVLDIDFLNNLFIAGFEQLRSEDGVRPIDIKNLSGNKKVIDALRDRDEVKLDLAKAELVLISPPYLSIDSQNKLKLNLSLELNYQVSMLGLATFKAVRIQAKTIFNVFHRSDEQGSSLNIKYLKSEVKDMIIPFGIGFFRREVSIPGETVKSSVNLIIEQYFKYFKSDKTTKTYTLPSVPLFGEETLINKMDVQSGQLIFDLN